jgi:hypothetical protein
MTRSETFREPARYWRPAVQDAGDEAMSLIARTHMRKDDRHGVVALLRDFERGEPPFPGKLTDLIFGAAQIIDVAGKRR